MYIFTFLCTFISLYIDHSRFVSPPNGTYPQQLCKYSHPTALPYSLLDLHITAEMSLQMSKWADRTRYSQSRIRSRAEVIAEDKTKAMRLLRRLYWKAEGLLHSYERARQILKSKVPSDIDFTDDDKLGLRDISLGLCTIDAGKRNTHRAIVTRLKLPRRSHV
jgi:hypothetical protein